VFQELEIDIAGFVQLMLRISAMHYPHLPKLADKFACFLQNQLFKYAGQLEPEVFWGTRLVYSMIISCLILPPCTHGICDYHRDGAIR